MKLFSCVVLLLTIFVTDSYAATASGYYNNPKNPGKCTINEKLILSPGDMVKDPHLSCGRISCAVNGLVIFNSCGIQMIEGCKMGAYIDRSLPYPDCCQRRFICDST